MEEGLIWRQITRVDLKEGLIWCRLARVDLEEELWLLNEFVVCCLFYCFYCTENFIHVLTSVLSVTLVT